MKVTTVLETSIVLAADFLLVVGWAASTVVPEPIDKFPVPEAEVDELNVVVEFS